MGIVDFLKDGFRGREDPARRYARQLAAVRSGLSGPAKSPALAALTVTGPPTLADPVSQMCTAAQFDEPVYQAWCDAMGVPRHMHRKQWEFVYILQALRHYGALREHARGIGFGVGREPLPAVFASLGCSVLATDLAAEDARAQVWHDTDQHVSEVDNLIWPGICSEELLREKVRFRPVDMNAIPHDLDGFDFTWSSCAYEHLGSIKAGLAFVEASLGCLKPGGIAVHTTEFNLTSNRKTLDHMSTVIFRRRDLESLALRLAEQGHSVAPFKFDPGDQPLDRHVDVAPYADHDHLKLALHDYVATSFGIVVRKAG